MRENSITILFLLSALALFLWLMTVSIDTQEKVECQKWQSQAAEFSGFYITHWQAEQCRAHNISVNAPIK